MISLNVYIKCIHTVISFFQFYPCFIPQFFIKFNKTHPAEWIPRWLASDFAKGLSQNMFPPCCGLRWGLQVSCPVKMFERFGPQQDNIPQTRSDDYVYMICISLNHSTFPISTGFFLRFRDPTSLRWPSISMAHALHTRMTWMTHGIAAWPSLLPALIIACRRGKIWRCVMFKLSTLHGKYCIYAVLYIYYMHRSSIKEVCKHIYLYSDIIYKLCMLSVSFSHNARFIQVFLCEAWLRKPYEKWTNDDLTVSRRTGIHPMWYIDTLYLICRNERQCTM